MDERTPDDPRYAEQMARVMAAELPEKWEREPIEPFPLPPDGAMKFTVEIPSQAERVSALCDSIRREASEQHG